MCFSSSADPLRFFSAYLLGRRPHPFHLRVDPEAILHLLREAEDHREPRLLRAPTVVWEEAMVEKQIFGTWGRFHLDRQHPSHEKKETIARKVCS